jgi:hypothetical protein
VAKTLGNEQSACGSILVVSDKREAQKKISQIPRSGICSKLSLARQRKRSLCLGAFAPLR